eukprot:COSAG02_NODE_373_length_23594_cov_6.892190_18_plen_415_part_00
MHPMGAHRRLLMVAALSLVTITAAALAAELHVSPTGSDVSGDGSAARPFATLPVVQAAARKALQQRPLTADVVVRVHPGTYYQREALRFSSADAGRDGFRMRWIGPGPGAGTDPATAAVVHGGVRVGGWKQVGDGPVWTADVSALAPAPSPLGSTGSDDSEPWRFFNLIEGQRGAVLARHPDFGSGYLKDVGCNNSQTSLQCPVGVLPDELSVADASVFANVGGNWFTATLSATAVAVDAAGRVNVTFEKDTGLLQANNKIYLQGAWQLISEAGEWALDSTAQPPTVYYWPRDATAFVAGNAHIVATTTTRVLDFRGESWEPPPPRAAALADGDDDEADSADGGLVAGVDVSGLVLSGSDFGANFTLFDRTNDTPVKYREGMVRFENSRCVVDMRDHAYMRSHMHALAYMHTTI